MGARYRDVPENQDCGGLHPGMRVSQIDPALPKGIADFVVLHYQAVEVVPTVVSAIHLVWIALGSRNVNYDGNASRLKRDVMRL